jgi:hypothetical protein
MLEARFRPLAKWKDGELAMTVAHFKMPHNKSLDLLEYELRKLDASDVIIECGFDFQQIRNDGWPRSGVAPTHPGIVLYFDGRDGAMRFPAGEYADWRANLHAIALTLENLRAIDRYGVTVGQHQQYLGFKALPAPLLKIDTLEAAALFVSANSDGVKEDAVIGSPNVWRGVYRVIASRLHPDKPSGNQAMWHLLQQARALLDEHHGMKEGAAS